MLHPRPQVHYLPLSTGEKPSGIRPGPKRGWRVHTGTAAFENGQLRRWKPFGLAREEVAGRRLLVAGSHTVFILYGAARGMYYIVSYVV